MIKALASIKAVWAKFTAEFWRGFYEARAQSGARAQPAPANPFESEAVKAALIDVVRGAYADGVSAERARIAEILQLPDASKFQELVIDLALGGDATPAQVAMVIARTEVHVQARIHPTESPPLESSTPTIH